MEKFRLKAIYLQREEGLLSEIQSVRVACSIEHANSILNNWRQTAPNHGYHKCKLILEWQNGQRYTMRYELDRNDPSSLQTEIDRYFRFWSGQAQPSHMTQAEYETILKWAGRTSDHLYLVENYEL